MLLKKLIGICIALAVIITTGVGGYVVIEGWRTFDAFYMTVITISSVGFMEVRPLSDAGRTFTVFLIFCGSGILIYAVSVITAFIVEGELTDVIRRRKMNRKIDRLDSHFIVCGADHTGRYAIEELLKTQRDFVVIEKDADKIAAFEKEGVLCVEGDATHDSVLLRAGIQRAKGFITSLHSDAENLFVVITAKRLNPSLRVISKAVEEESEQKIRMVGADGVVMPDFIGGLRMVSEMVRPSVVNFLDIMLRSTDRAIRVEEITLGQTSSFIGKKLSETGLSDMEGVSVVALKDKSDDSYTFNPSHKTLLTADHILIVMGYIDRIQETVARLNPS
jgi:voltage-gated potassium channel